jgi:hypothetical protein
LPQSPTYLVLPETNCVHLANTKRSRMTRTMPSVTVMESLLVLAASPSAASDAQSCP